MEHEDEIFTLEGLKAEHLKAAKIDKSVLISIYRDFIANQEVLRQQAEYFANILHLGEEVNSVKRRVKDPLHLLAKIVRKRKEALEKGKESPYLTISVDNYKDIVDDLVGIRAIYLFKENWTLVNDFILNNFSVCEDKDITINHAIDDDLSFYAESDNVDKKYNYKLLERDSRYRSTHYIIRGITPHVFNFELQTRSILDEAWGEIDHHIRYPDFENHIELKRKMSILNGAISGCEELTSNFFKDFNELRVKSNTESELLVSETTPHLTAEEADTSKSNTVTEIIDDTAKVSDELWDNIIESASLARSRERLLKSKIVLNHNISLKNENSSKSSKEILEDYLMRGLMINLNGNTKIQKTKVNKPPTSIINYKKMIDDVAKDIPIKDDKDDKDEE